MNQKGFVIAPVILWIVGALVLTGIVSVKEGLIPVDLSEKITHDGSRTGPRIGYQSYCHPEQGVVIYENEKMPFVTDEGENVLWTKGDIDCYKGRKLAEKNIQVPIPTPLPPIQPKPTQKPVVQQGIQANQNNQTAQGRTGRIVKYKEYCKGGKEISVYESELITKKTADGNTYSMTKDDWDCSERDSKQRQNSPSQSATINCYDPLTKKNYQVSKETCDKWVQEYNQTTSYTPPQYYSCTICYSALNRCETYTHLYKTKEECTYQQSINNSNPTPRPITEDQAQVTINQQIYEFQKQEQQQANRQCKSDALSWYQVQIRNARARFGGTGSAARAAQEITKAEYDRKFKDCDALYPI